MKEGSVKLLNIVMLIKPPQLNFFQKILGDGIICHFKLTKIQPLELNLDQEK